MVSSEGLKENCEFAFFADNNFDFMWLWVPLFTSFVCLNKLQIRSEDDLPTQIRCAKGQLFNKRNVQAGPSQSFKNL